jgi:hypothetical protein
MANYTFTKASCILNKLHDEIFAVLPGLVTIEYLDPNGTCIFSSDLTSGQQTTLQSLITAHAASSGIILTHKYMVETAPSGKVTKRSYYTTKTGNTFSGLVLEEIFNYSKSLLMSKTTNTYYSDGVLASSETTSYSTGSQGERVEHYS